MVVAVALLTASSVHAAIVIEVDLGADDSAAHHAEAFRDALVRREIPLQTPSQTTAAWESALHLDVDPAVESALLRAAPDLAAGRSLFFENRYPEAIAILDPWLSVVERDPAVLSAHPDLASAVVDGLLVLVRALDASGSAEQADAVLERLVTMAWVASPDPTEFPPSFVGAWDSAKALQPTRAVGVEWTGGDSCALFVNGFPASADNGRELRLPAGTHFLQVRCAEVASRIYALGSRQPAIRIDLAFDDALRREDGRLLLAPRSESTDGIHRLAMQAASVLGEPEVFTVARRDADGRAFVEVTRVAVDGSAPPRAVRLAVDAASADGWDAAVGHLVDGAADPDPAYVSDLVVWTADRAWGDGRRRSVDLRRVRRSAWSFAGATLGAVALGAVFEARLVETRDDLGTCAADRDFCGQTDTMPALRSEARSARTAANIAWAAAGVSGVAAGILAAAGREPRDTRRAEAVPNRADRTRVDVGFGPTSVIVRLRY